MASYLDVDDFAQLCDDRPRPLRDGWIVKCPAHEDGTRSLTVRRGERGILVYCFAGCQLADICGALSVSVGQLFEDYRQSPGNGSVATRHLLRHVQAIGRNRAATTLRSLDDVARDLWSGWLTNEDFLRAQSRWPDETFLPLNEVDEWLVTNGYLGDLWERQIWNGTIDWMSMKVRRTAFSKMRVRWRESGLIVLT